MPSPEARHMDLGTPGMGTDSGPVVRQRPGVRAEFVVGSIFARVVIPAKPRDEPRWKPTLAATRRSFPLTCPACSALLLPTDSTVPKRDMPGAQV